MVPGRNELRTYGACSIVLLVCKLERRCWKDNIGWLGKLCEYTWTCFNIKTFFRYRIPIIKIRPSWDCLIFITRISILARKSLLSSLDGSFILNGIVSLSLVYVLVFFFLITQLILYIETAARFRWHGVNIEWPTCCDSTFAAHSYVTRCKNIYDLPWS